MSINENINGGSIGFLRIKQVLQLYPVSKSTWWDGVRHGRYPKPLKLGVRVTVWRASDIFELIKSVENNNV